jgi:hypothetical protein
MQQQDEEDLGEAKSRVLSISFNQSKTFFTLAMDTGFSLYRVNPLEKMCERDLGGGIGIAVQLFETNFFGLVGGGSNPKFPTCKLKAFGSQTWSKSVSRFMERQMSIIQVWQPLWR